MAKPSPPTPRLDYHRPRRTRFVFARVRWILVALSGIAVMGWLIYAATELHRRHRERQIDIQELEQMKANYTTAPS